jgi:hypothetical protein
VDEGWFDAQAGKVYGAAVAAAGDKTVAIDVAREVLAAGPGPQPVERALVMAVRRSPAGPFAQIPPGDREAVVLARLGGCDVAQIAGALAIEQAEVRRRLTSGVRALAAAAPRPDVRGGVLRKLRPRPGFGSAASPAPGARAS